MRRLVISFLVGAVACESPEIPGGSYYQAHIDPIFEHTCQSTLSGCHVAVEGQAAGNLDLGSYDSLRLRSDLLVPYGPYSQPLLVLKASEPTTIFVDTHDAPDPSAPEDRFVAVRTDIRHAGGPGLVSGSPGRADLQRWLADGFDRYGVPVQHAVENSGPCAPGAGSALGFSVADVPDAALFGSFVDTVQPILRERCAGDSCHGAALTDFHLACGDDEDERRWNYWISTQFLSADLERSELLRKPLAQTGGGSYHGGGDTFANSRSDGYTELEAWADSVVTTAPELTRETEVSDGYRFFVNRVQPALVRKGCMALACHSPLSIVFQLRGGSGGAFSRLSRRINYHKALELLALESPDPDQSRIIAKNLIAVETDPDGRGILHRGGPLFAMDGEPTCDGVDADSGSFDETPALCILRRWHQIERDARVAEGSLDSELRGLVWVSRPLGVGSVTDFATYRPGADLLFSDATRSGGALDVAPSRSLLEPCGIDPTTADIRRPRASWDGRRVAFAARRSESSALRLYEIELDSGTCRALPGASEVDERDGIGLHDFDPAYAPDGRIVFASTRGATRTPARLEPNADLYVLDPDSGDVRQLTFLLNQELAPGFLPDGRVIYTVEKRELDFHALALRRQNIDGGDYHPLYASRPSLGFEGAHDVAIMPNGNGVFVALWSSSVDGAGEIVTFNRTLGPDQDGRDMSERGYMPSMGRHIGSLFGSGVGAFRSPSPLPWGDLLASCVLGAATMPVGALDYDVCVVDPRTGSASRLLGDAGSAEVDAIAIYARPNRGVFASDGGGIDRPVIEPGQSDAIVQFNDFPMIQSLMFRNTREGRPIDFRIGGFDVLRHQPPPNDMRELAGDGVIVDSFGAFYSSYETLGWVPLYEDGSTSMRLPGGIPISFRMTDAEGAPLDMAEGMPFDGPALQREHEQYYPGERIKRSIPRRFFNTTCGGCHGSISGRELDVSIDADVVTGASANLARGVAPHDLMR